MAEAALLDALDLNRLNAITDETDGFDPASFARQLIAGEMSPEALSPRRILDGLMANVRAEAAAIAAGLAAPVGLCLLLRLLFGSGSAAARAPKLLCALCCLSVMAGCYARTREICDGLMARLAEASTAMTPVLVTVMSVTGAASTGAILTPLSAECAWVIQAALRGWGVGLCGVAAMVAAAGSLSESFPLEQLFRLVRTLHRWLLALMLLGFTAMLSARGTMASARDSMAAQAARGAIEGMIPVIGGELSGTAGTLAASAGVIRGAVGISGAAVILRLCVGPAVRVASVMLALKLAAAIIEPMAEPRTAQLVGRFGEVAEMLLACCAVCAAMVVLLAGACAVSVGGVLNAAG